MNYQIAAAELLDAYGDQLFRYCWSMLRSREMAQIALRDTLFAAEADDPRPEEEESFRSWLYSLARAECRQHQAAPAAGADEAPGRPGRNDAGSRLMAWQAAMSLEAGEFEVLELACRHDVDPGLVLGLPAGEAAALQARARLSLTRALGAEILANRDPACPDLAWVLAGVLAGGRAGVLADRTGPMTADFRERVLGHAALCRACADKQPRNVSAARVFALLPAPALSPLARADLLDSFAGHQQAAPLVQGLRGASRRSGRPRRAGRRRPARRGGLLIAGAGAIASARGDRLGLRPGRTGGPAHRGPRERALRGGRGAPAGTALQASRSRRGGPGPGPGPRRPRLRPGPGCPRRRRWSAPAGGRSQVPITAATQPLPSAQAPAAQDGTRSQSPGPGARPDGSCPGHAAALGGERQRRRRLGRPDHAHRGGRGGQLVGEQCRAGTGRPEQLRGHAAGRAERHADGGGHPGRRPGERGPHLQAARRRAAAGPCQLDRAVAPGPPPSARRPRRSAVPVAGRVPVAGASPSPGAPRRRARPRRPAGPRRRAGPRRPAGPRRGGPVASASPSPASS